jgi:hypothetical protein
MLAGLRRHRVRTGNQRLRSNQHRLGDEPVEIADRAFPGLIACRNRLGNRLGLGRPH